MKDTNMNKKLFQVTALIIVVLGAGLTGCGSSEDDAVVQNTSNQNPYGGPGYNGWAGTPYSNQPGYANAGQRVRNTGGAVDGALHAIALPWQPQCELNPNDQLSISVQVGGQTQLLAPNEEMTVTTGGYVSYNVIGTDSCWGIVANPISIY